MKKSMDWKLISGVILAYLLIYLTFDIKQVFWYLYTATMLFLISYTIIIEKVDDEVSSKQYLFYGILSGILLYALFAIGNGLLSFFPASFTNQVGKLYSFFSLEWIWHYFVLILIIIPGEEIFWRGFIQKRLMRYLKPRSAIFTAAIINSVVFLFSGYPILMLAAFISGLLWGVLYAWKRSMPLLIISHLTFDLLLLIIMPLH